MPIPSRSTGSAAFQKLYDFICGKGHPDRHDAVVEPGSRLSTNASYVRRLKTLKYMINCMLHQDSARQR